MQLLFTATMKKRSTEIFLGRILALPILILLGYFVMIVMDGDWRHFLGGIVIGIFVLLLSVATKYGE